MCSRRAAEAIGRWRARKPPGPLASRRSARRASKRRPSRCPENRAPARPSSTAVELRLLPQRHALRRGAPGEEGVHVGAQPVGVGDLVARAGGDEQAGVVVGAVGVRRALALGVEGEAALQAPAQLREGAQPAAVGGERVQVGQVVAAGQPLERQVGERRRGLAEREARVAAALEEHHAVAQPGEDAGQDRAGEARADDRDVAALAHAAPQAAQATRGSAAPPRLIRPRRASRGR